MAADEKRIERFGHETIARGPCTYSVSPWRSGQTSPDLLCGGTVCVGREWTHAVPRESYARRRQAVKFSLFLDLRMSDEPSTMHCWTPVNHSVHSRTARNEREQKLEVE